MNTDSNQTQTIQTAGKSFLQSLFDLSFSQFITPKLIKVIYVVFIVIFAIYGLILIGVGFVAAANGRPAGLLLIPVAVIVFFVGIILTRVWLELVMVFFSMLDRLKSIDAKTKS